MLAKRQKLYLSHILVGLQTGGATLENSSPVRHNATYYVELPPTDK